MTDELENIEEPIEEPIEKPVKDEKIEFEEEQLKEMRLEILENSSDTSKDEIFKLKLKRAKFRYLRLVYPFKYKTMTEIPDEQGRDWQTKCAIELYNLAGDENLKSYSENGLSESYARAGLSQDLLNELPPPHGGVPE